MGGGRGRGAATQAGVLQWVRQPPEAQDSQAQRRTVQDGKDQRQVVKVFVSSQRSQLALGVDHVPTRQVSGRDCLGGARQAGPARNVERTEDVGYLRAVDDDAGREVLRAGGPGRGREKEGGNG